MALGTSCVRSFVLVRDARHRAALAKAGDQKGMLPHKMRQHALLVVDEKSQ